MTCIVAVLVFQKLRAGERRIDERLNGDVFQSPVFFENSLYDFMTFMCVMCLTFKLTISGLSSFQFSDDMHQHYLTIVSVSRIAASCPEITPSLLNSATAR